MRRSTLRWLPVLVLLNGSACTSAGVEPLPAGAVDGVPGTEAARWAVPTTASAREAAFQRVYPLPDPLPGGPADGLDAALRGF